MEQRNSLYIGIVAIVKGAFGSPSTNVTNFTICPSTRMIWHWLTPEVWYGILNFLEGYGRSYYSSNMLMSFIAVLLNS